MRWNPGHRSVNVEDRRGAGGGFMRGAGGMGAGGLVILVILSLIFGRDFVSLASDPGVAQPGAESGDVPPAETTPEEERLVSLVSSVLDDAQNTWRQVSSEMGTPYRDAKLVLFRDAVQSACGFAEAATGPFYCPADEKVYIDLGFYEELQQRFGAPGDFAQAYVLAHEIGHHVQNLLGTEAQVREARTRRADLANELSVRLELQADCYAGVWAHSVYRSGDLEEGDIEEAFAAAEAVGDDRLQSRAGGSVNPDTFTHGTSEQRRRWFDRGRQAGEPEACDTFGVDDL